MPLRCINENVEVIVHMDVAWSLREWLRRLVVESAATVSDADELEAQATRAVTLVTCSSDISGLRDRTLVVFVFRQRPTRLS